MVGTSVLRAACAVETIGPPQSRLTVQVADFQRPRTMKHSPSSPFGLTILFAAALAPCAWSFERGTSSRAMQRGSELAAPAATTQWHGEEPGLLPEVQASPLPLPIERSAYESRERTAFANGRRKIDEPTHQAECFTFDDLVVEMRNLAQTIGDLSINPYGHLQGDVVSATDMAAIEGQVGAAPGLRRPYHAPIEVGGWGHVGDEACRDLNGQPGPEPAARTRPFDLDARAPAPFRLGLPDELPPGASRDAYPEGVPAATAEDWARW